MPQKNYDNSPAFEDDSEAFAFHVDHVRLRQINSERRQRHAFSRKENHVDERTEFLRIGLSEGKE